MILGEAWMIMSIIKMRKGMETYQEKGYA